MEAVLVGAIPALMVFGTFYWMTTMGVREQKEADKFAEDWMRKNGKM